MSDQRSEDTEKPTFSEEQQDKNVLVMLLVDGAWPWTVDELIREMQSKLEVLDALPRLERAGLIHRFGEFVVPTRAARRAEEISGGAL